MIIYKVTYELFISEKFFAHRVEKRLASTKYTAQKSQMYFEEMISERTQDDESEDEEERDIHKRTTFSKTTKEGDQNCTTSEYCP